MPIYRGSSADGWDMREVQGAFISPDGNEWSTKPYTLEQFQHLVAYNKKDRSYEAVAKHLTTEKHSIVKELKLINEKKSKLPRKLRLFIVDLLSND